MANVADSAPEEFQPPSDWDHDNESDTLILMLPGFRKEQLRVQVGSNRVLRVSGERKISENKWRRFRKELPLPESSDTSGIGAKFEAGMLYVRIPKVIKPQPLSPTKTTPEPPIPQQQTTTTTDQKPDADSEKSKVDKAEPQSQTPPQEPHKAEEELEDNQTQKKEKDKAETVANNKTSDEVQETHGISQTPFQEQKAPDHEDSQKNEKGKVETDSVKEGVKENIEKAVTSKAEETHGTSHDDELGKRLSVLTKIKKRSSSTLNTLSGLAEEVKKQHKLANLVVIIILLLLIGLYIKDVVKSSFGGPKSEEF